MFSENIEQVKLKDSQASHSIASQTLALGDMSVHVIARGVVQTASLAHYSVFAFASDVTETELTNVLTQLVNVNGDLASLYPSLSGSFAFILIDEKSQSVHLFNDHVGCQPCYYYQLDKKLYISDSLKFLKQYLGQNVNHALSISPQAIYNYMYFHCIPSPSTIYQAVYKLEPAKSVCFNAESTKTESVLYAPEFSSVSSDQSKLRQKCLSVIDQAVANESDGNCGAFLSGGLDSSTVAGMLAKHKQPAKTFSIGFNADGYDETPYAQITAKHFNTEHQVLYLQSEQAAQAFVEVAQYFDEPFGNSSAMAAYFCAKFAKEHGVDTLLAGDGGDELFAGNERYAKQKLFEYYAQLPSPLRIMLNATLNNDTMAKIPGLSKVASYVRQATVQLPERLQSYNFINIVGIEQMFSPDFLNQIDINQPIEQLRKRYSESNGEHPVDNMLYLDWKFTLADNDLVKVNKMCELAGVNVKFPLLAKSVVDFSCQVPADVKLPAQRLRDFYKQACRGFLADETLDKSKHGFGLPFGVWLKENKELKSIADNALEAFKARNIVSEQLIEQALTAHQSVHSGYYGELIWIMVVLELWLQGNEAVS